MNRKAVIEKIDKSLVISAPSAKNISLVVFLITSSAFWILGEKIVISLILSISVFESTDYFFLLWFVFWTFLGFLLFVKLVWLLAGKEVITVSSDAIKLEKVYAGVRKEKKYLLHGVRDLRIEEPQFFRRHKGVLFSIFFKGFIKFEYGVKTITFMSSVESDEAAYILEQINNHISAK